METLKLDNWGDLPENYTGIFDFCGSIYYYLNGKRHREDGPAVICLNGNGEYYLNGLIHREDGPVIIYPGGSENWYLNGKNITKKVNDWIIENNIPEVWDNSHKLLFKLTFG